MILFYLYTINTNNNEDKLFKKYIQYNFDCYFKMMTKHAFCLGDNKQLSDNKHTSYSNGEFDSILTSISTNLKNPFNDLKMKEYIEFDN